MSGFFGFWVKKYRLSYLLTLFLIAIGVWAIYSIPKESSPNVNLGMVSIVTAYPWASPQDIDSLVSDKIYKQIENIDWISKITSTSSLGISSVQVTAKTNADFDKLVSDIRNKVASAWLPSEAKNPNVTTIETKNDSVFSLYIYKDSLDGGKSELLSKANSIKERLESLPNIKSVDFSVWSAWISAWGWSVKNSPYTTEIIISSEKMKAYGLTLSQISQSINAFNRDQPIGNYEIGDKKYDYRISWKFNSINDFLSTPITLPLWGSITLREIASTERIFTDTSVVQTLTPDKKLANAFGITIKKKDTATIFEASREAKEAIEALFRENNFKGFGYTYAVDTAWVIMDDYKDLAHEGINTLVLVFIAMFLFVGFADALFATLTLPLAFLATFVILKAWGYSMNFLTNFSLILSFGIAIDTIIVFVQAASMKMRVGFDPKTAIALALREYAIPTIVWVTTTIVVFVPLMSLPGVTWKFLAYIPVTIFWVLATGLVLALTLNIALYLLVIKPKKYYSEDKEVTDYLSPEAKELLAIERTGKILQSNTKVPYRTKVLHKAVHAYKNFQRWYLQNTLIRRLGILIPVTLFFLGTIFLAPRVWFELMPSDDNNQLSYTISGPVGLKTEEMASKLGNIERIFEGFKEIKNASVTTKDNTSTVSITLTPYTERRSKWEQSVFDIEKIITPRLSWLVQKWLKVQSKIAWMGAPTSASTVGIDLKANSSDKLSELIQVSKDFENFIKSIAGTKNVISSSVDTPGQFIFTLNKELLALKWIPATTIYNTIATETNGITVGSIEESGEDIDIKLKNSDYSKAISPDEITNLSFTVWKITYRIWDFITTNTQNAVQQISRKNGEVVITVGSDLENKSKSVEVTNQITAFAKTYKFPPGITYSAWGENNENKDLVVAMVVALLISVVTIFAILTWEFDSFSRPAIVFYSVFMAIPFVFLGLFITGNPMSMMFGIGFIAFMGIAVNHGIILIDAVKVNMEKWMDTLNALVEAGASRLEPMVLTTITTVIGMIPIALKNKMWAWMGWTIIFGLTATTIITLLTLLGLFYELYANKKTKKIKLIQRFRQRILKKQLKTIKQKTVNTEIPEEIPTTDETNTKTSTSHIN